MFKQSNQNFLHENYQQENKSFLNQQPKKFEDEFEFMRISNKIHSNIIPSKINTPQNIINMIGSDLKHSKAYIHAMKALQERLKKLENIIEELKNENLEKMQQKNTNIGQLEKEIKENSMYFTEKETNFKNRIINCEKEIFEKNYSIEVLENEMRKLQENFEMAIKKNEGEFQIFLKEKNEFKSIINDQDTKIKFLDSTIESLQIENNDIKKIKRQCEEEMLHLKEKNNKLQEKLIQQMSIYETEK